MPTKNIDLLKRLQTELLTMPPELFNQKGMWASADDQGHVSASTLGWTLLLQGYRFIGQNRFLSPAGVEVDPRLAAEKELGLTQKEAADLFVFWSEADLHNPRKIAKWIGEIIRTGKVEIPRSKDF